MHGDVKELIREYIVKTAELKKLEDSEEIIETNYLDSMEFVKFAVWLGEQFNIIVSEDDLTEENFRNLQRITDFVKNKSNK